MDSYLTATEIKKIYKIGLSSLKYWESQGILHPLRTPGGHRRYSELEIQTMMGLHAQPIVEKKCAIYARVSTQEQAESSNLDRQFERLVHYAESNGYSIVSTHKEIDSGLNENRKELKKLLSIITEGKIDTILIEYKDRLARFGYRYLEEYCKAFNVAILEIEQQTVNESQEELVEDMISIVTSFSARIYGKRGGRVAKQLETVIISEVTSSENNG